MKKPSVLGKWRARQECIKSIKTTKTGNIVNIEYVQKNDPREEIFQFIIKSKWSLIEMNPQSDNLEDIFRKLTKSKK